VEKGKFAILFGTELNRPTDEAMSLSEEFVTIPMYGFTKATTSPFRLPLPSTS
jgi:tRNA G18 (ribose-2'-O)-methylase SpoU